ncbi:T9SS type A sorting domain-containing protein [Mangrovimonas sp. ST2L15]|uniref:T9SS type A sorting domain-containing protein n=1 Tax=Mangrovimonas sp. ST2L15 TaxID=1645916 RepID=UPI0006B51BF3|nr:T9SS type A sorting domain-containing protein [Mangrovimonas sp. ST2L15]
MKKITLLLLLLANVGLAQITYQSSDFAQIGDNYIMSRINTGIQTTDFTITGENFDWDFSALSVTSQETVSWDDPNNSGYKTTWCLTNGYVFNCNAEFNNAFNLATQVVDGIEIQDYGVTNLVAHYMLDSAALQNKMLGASLTIAGIAIPFTVDFENPDVVYEFPMNYSDVYTNNGNFELDLNTLGIPILYTSEIERTNDVEGWGSLVTPYDTYSDVLKMKTTVIQNDTVVTETETIPTTRTTITYSWFDANYGVPVMQVIGEDVAGTFVPTSASYIDVEQCLDPNAFFSYYPVAPEFDYETNSVAVTFFNVSNNYDSVSWDFGDGTPITENNPTYTFECPGVHQVILTITNEFCDPNLEDSITLPVVISDPDGLYTNAVTVDATSLTAVRDTEGTSYQWVDCDNDNTAIEGETSQVFMPSEDGTYAVILTTNGCTSMSACYTFESLSVSSYHLDDQIKLYPNPTTGMLQVISKETISQIQVFDVLGKQIGSSLNLSKHPSGIYFVKLTSQTGSVTKKIIKL